MALLDSVSRALAPLARAANPRAGQRSRRPTSGGMHNGGFMNPSAGIGNVNDKSRGSFFLPSRFWWQGPLEVLVVQSWAAAKFVNIPIDDQFIRWRRFMGENESATEKMAEAEDKHKVKQKLARAMKAGRQYGTGVMVMMTKDDQLDTPLLPERVRPGDLTNLLVLNRYELAVPERDHDLYSDNYGQPLYYDLFPHRGGTVYPRVHHSRVLRFDGIEPSTDSGFTVYDWDWGISELVPVILALTEDQNLASAITYLSLEASIPVLKVSQLREAVAGQLHQSDPNAPSADAIGSSVNELKSSHRLLMLDKDTEDFQRIQVQFAGLPDLLDKFQARVAAAADIPQTRWMGRSPAGLNATGDSDMHNYVMMVEAHREEKLPAILDRLDMVLARDAGIGEPPEYEWRSLIELGEKDQAEVAKLKVEAAKGAAEGGFIDEDEGRAALNGDAVLGALEGKAPEPPEPDLLDNPFGPDGPPVPPDGPPEPPDDAS